MVLEDFTGYTEVDPGNCITVNSAVKASFVNLPFNQTGEWLYYDKGANHFGDFEHLFKVRFATSEVESSSCIWGVGNQLKNGRDAWIDRDPLIFTQCSYQAGGVCKISFGDTVNQNADTYDGVVDTDYYCTVKREGTTGTLKIYSDAARTNLLDTLTITVTTTQMRYIFALLSYYYVGLSVEINDSIEDLDLQEEVPPPPTAILKPMKYW